MIEKSLGYVCSFCASSLLLFFLFSAEIVLTQLWWDLLDPYVKQNPKTTHSPSSPLCLSLAPFFLALVTFLKNILSTMIKLYLLFTVCWLHLCWALDLCVLFDVFFWGFPGVTKVKVVCCFSLKTRVVCLFLFYFEMNKLKVHCVNEMRPLRETTD